MTLLASIPFVINKINVEGLFVLQDVNLYSLLVRRLRQSRASLIVSGKWCVETWKAYITHVEHELTKSSKALAIEIPLSRLDRSATEILSDICLF